LGVITVASVALSAIFDAESVRLVGDVADIPRTLPRPMLPDFSLLPALILPAFAIGVVGLVQGAGVGQAYPNPDGKYPDSSKDFSGQGVANVAASFFQAIPSGGSMSGTAVAVQAGARTRWTNISAGFCVIIIVLLFVNVVKAIPMAGLGGLLVVVGFQNLRPAQIITVWETNKLSRAAMLLTLASTLMMPLQFAILVGVAISFLLTIVRAAEEIEMVEIVPQEAAFPIEIPASTELAGGRVTVLHARGSLFFAAAASLEEGLPDPGNARRAVVVFNLRERPELGSTMIGVLSRYALSLKKVDGRLMLCGVSPSLKKQLDRTGLTKTLGPESLFMEGPQLGAAMNEAVAAGRTWLDEPHSPGDGK
ncbi:MAG: SulP family inorganic anion transporter, partial [Gammaproteobacteria bacterium]